MTRRVWVLAVIGCVVTQTVVNLQQMRLNDALVRTQDTQATVLTALAARVDRVEQMPKPDSTSILTAPAPAPRPAVGGGARSFGPPPWQPPKE